MPRLLRVDFTWLGLLAVSFAVLFAAMTFHDSSMVSRPEYLDQFLTGDLPIGHWVFENAPFKYRLVFRGGTELLAAVLPGDPWLTRYHRAFLALSFGSFVAAGGSLYLLLRALRFEAWLAALGTLAWATLPPVLGAYLMPTQTREDFLACAFLNLGLWAILTRRDPWLLAVIVLGVLTRETLLLVPVLLALTPSRPLGFRLLALALGAAAYLGPRVALGLDHHEAVETGLMFSLHHPTNAVMGIVMLFGWAWWLAALAPWRGGDPAERVRASLPGGAPPAVSLDDPAERRAQFEAWTIPAFVLVVGTHALLARIEEIRISLLFAPWLIYALLRVLEGRRLPLVRTALAAGVVGAAIVLLEGSGAATALRERVNPHVGYFAAKEWWLIGWAQLAVGAAVVALSWPRGSRESSPAGRSPAPPPDPTRSPAGHGARPRRTTSSDPGTR